MAYETLVNLVVVFSFDYTGIVKQKDRPGRKIYPCMYKMAEEVSNRVR